LENLLSINKAILLDRLDYLISKNGFDETLLLIQKLNDLFYVERGVLLISLDPQTLGSRELRLLEKETKGVRLKKAPVFPEDLREILKFIYGMNKAGEKPPYKEVVKKFNVTRTTARKKIRELKARGLITEAKKGRSKVLELTPEGLEYF
jgi:predicted transcriptional regulator